MIQQYPSRLLETAVQEFAKLPGIGRKTALRLVLYMLRMEHEEVGRFTEAIDRLKNEVMFCRVCHNISDQEVCPICPVDHPVAVTGMGGGRDQPVRQICFPGMNQGVVNIP